MSQDVDDNDQRDRRNSDSGLRFRSSQQQTGPLMSKIRNLNNLALTSIGSLFSGPPLAKTVSHLQKDQTGYAEQFEPNGYDSGGSGGWRANDGLAWQDIPQPEANVQEDEDLTPLAQNYDILRPEDYCVAKNTSRLQGLGLAGSGMHSDDSKLPENARSSSTQAHISTRFPEVRRLFGNISRSRQAPGQLAPSVSESDYFISPPSNAAFDYASTTPYSLDTTSLHSEGKLSSHDHLASATHSGDLETPPLTPDSLNNHVFSSPALFLDRFDAAYDLRSPKNYEPCSSNFFGVGEENRENDEGVLYTGPHLLEVKEGKKPERSIDLNGDLERDASLLNPSEMAGNSPVPAEDQEEWYGLEYTLELSSRERQPSDTQSYSAGEHSKSRESWAAIHRGTIHPFFEDEDYHQWKNWHRFLDRQDEKKRHKKGFEFKARSKDLAWFYADEMRTRDVLYWQKEVYGVLAREVKERLNYITERRPDPYFPPKKHNRAWYLKRSLSVSCLRELKPRENVAKFEKRGAGMKDST